MRIIAHHTKFYDWEVVPNDVKVTQSDISSGKVMPGRDGGWKMRVTKEPAGGTHTQINLPEHEIVSKIIEEKLRNGTTITRKQAVAMYLAQYVLPNHTHRSWLSSFEVNDDGPHEETLRSELNRHINAGNIDAGDVESHLLAYLEPVDVAGHVNNLHKHFRVNKKVS
jgi:hypothetical protein